MNEFLKIFSPPFCSSIFNFSDGKENHPRFLSESILISIENYIARPIQKKKKKKKKKKNWSFPRLLLSTRGQKRVHDFSKRRFVETLLASGFVAAIRVSKRHPPSLPFFLTTDPSVIIIVYRGKRVAVEALISAISFASKSPPFFDARYETERTMARRTIAVVWSK